jgi:aminomuconate-semialdehyde/2-hydroxymuconate-6-semialdehyde dehydrogenase
MTPRFTHDGLPRGLLPESPGHFIDGAFTGGAGDGVFETLAPATDEPLALVPLGGAAEVDRAVQAAKAALRGPWGRASITERSRVLKRLASLVREHLVDLARLESMDSGKPISETETGDMPRSAANLEFFAELIAHAPLVTHVGEGGARHTSFREPIGVVGLITPWNLPLYLATWKIAPALAAGNTVVLKPAELTPLSAMAFARLCQEAGLPSGVLNVVQGFGADGAGQALVKHPDVKAISFTGETLTGEAIMRDASPHLKKLSFELGGKGASVVFADADLETAARTATRAAFRNQGQICLAGSRLLVERKVAGQVVDRIVQLAGEIRVGDPLDARTTMGSLIARAHRDRVDRFVELARRREAGCGEVLRGGRVPAGLTRGAFYEPTVIAGVAQSSRLVQEEIFGPVLTVQTFDEDDEALELLNGTPYGLSCSIWSRDLQRAERAAARARFGLVWLNSWFLRDLHTAFGGMKRSGIGREGGTWSLDFYSELKTVSSPAPEGDL